MKALKNIRFGIAIMAVIMVCSLGWSLEPASARGLLKSPANAGEESTIVPMKKGTIEKKSLETVTTKFGDVYTLFVETIIVNTDGQQISIRDLPVPCDAEIVYTSGEGTRKALRIGIVSVHEGATTNWSARHPN